MEFKHISVLLNECIDGLNIKEDGIYVDCTLGGAGHSSHILKHLSKKAILCFVLLPTNPPKAIYSIGLPSLSLYSNACFNHLKSSP